MKFGSTLGRAASLAACFACVGAHAQNLIFWNDFEPDTCPAGRIVQSDLLYYSAYNMPIASHVDMTEWTSIWGRGFPGDPILDWPGQHSVSVVIEQFPRNGYIAAHFTVPEGATYIGSINHGSYLAGADLTGAVSRACGDFLHTEPRCTLDAGPGEYLSRWRTEASTGQCTLEPGDYYLNIRLTDPAQIVGGCGSVSCQEGLQSIWN